MYNTKYIYYLEISMKKKIKWMVISIGLIAFYTFAAAGILCSSEDETLAYGCILAVALAYLPANVAKKKGKEFWTWYAYGLLLGIIAIIHSIILKPVSSSEKSSSENSTDSNISETKAMNSDNRKSAKTKIASLLGIGFVALILVFMIFGTGASRKVGKWKYSKATANGSGDWYIRFTQNNDAIFKLDVKGEIPNYLIGLDFFVNDFQKGTGWTKVSDSSEMGINNFNSNPEKMIASYPIIGKYKGNWGVIYNGMDLCELRKKGYLDFCWGELTEGKVKPIIKYQDLSKYLD